MLAPYIIIICVGLFLISLFNSLFLTGATVFYCVGFTLLNFVLVLGVDSLFAWIIHSLPIKLFSPTKKIFRVFSWELPFYEKIGIQKWKGYVAELGGLGKFKKAKMQTREPEYLLRFLQEGCCGEIIHYFCCFAGLANLALIRFDFLTIALPVILVNFVLHIPPILIQRYNRPRLLRVYNLAEKTKRLREQRQADSTTDATTANI